MPTNQCMIESTVQMRKSIKNLFTVLLAKDAQDSLYSRLVQGASGTFALKVISTGLYFLISLLLARLLKATGYGAYSYAMAWVHLLIVPTLMGLDNLIVREVAVYKTQSAWNLIHGLLHWSNLVVLFLSVGLAILAALVAWILEEQVEAHLVSGLWVALIMLPLVALTHLRQAAMLGLQHIVIGQLPTMLIRPMLFIILVTGMYLFLGDSITAPGVMSLQVMAAGIAFIIAARQLRTKLSQLSKQVSPTYQGRIWMSSALPLLFVSGMYIVNAQTDTIMLGTIKGAEAAGIYVVANRGAELITFVLLAVNTALGPTIASLYAAKDLKRLQRVITKSARVTLLLTLPIASVLILFGYWFLLIFGQDFTQGENALTILSAGQLINAAMGSVGLMLIMTGHEHDAAVGIGVSAVLNVILNASLIPRWGIEGAACATAISLILWNLLLAIMVYKRLGIYSTALGHINLRSKA